MSEKEHMECVKFAIERTKGRLPIIAGTGSNCTRTAIDMSKEAASYGADGLLVVTPYYNKATQEGLVGHYTAAVSYTHLQIFWRNASWYGRPCEGICFGNAGGAFCF